MEEKDITRKIELANSEKFNKSFDHRRTNKNINEVILKAKETMSKFQKHLNNQNYNQTTNIIINLTENQPQTNSNKNEQFQINKKYQLNKSPKTFNKEKNFTKNIMDNQILKDIKEKENKSQRRNNLYNNFETEGNDIVNQTYIRKQTDFDLINNFENEHNKMINKKLNSMKQREKILNKTKEENKVLKSEINKLIDENKYLISELTKSKSEIKKLVLKQNELNIQSPKSEVNFAKLNMGINSSKGLNSNIGLNNNNNEELSKMLKESKSRNRIQKKRIDDMEQIIKDKTDYITNMELKLKEINSNVEKNNMYRTKYNELQVRFDIINKELIQLRKVKNKYNELMHEYESLKANYNNLLKNKDKMTQKRLFDERKILLENLDKLKKENISLKNEMTNQVLNLTQNDAQYNFNNDNDKKIQELKFENNSLKDIASELQNKNRDITFKLQEMTKKFNINKKQYLENINKLQKDIVSFKKKELKEKEELENKVKNYEIGNNKVNKIYNELEEYKNKCNILEESKHQLKNELRKLKQEKELLSSNLFNLNKSDIIPKNNSVIVSKNQNFELITNNKNNINRESTLNMNQIKLEEIEKEKEILKLKNAELEKNIGIIQKKNEDLIKENNKLETKKNELIQQINNMNDIEDVSQKDLIIKNMDLKKVVDVLQKQLEKEISKKNEVENKFIKYQQKFNKQIDEASERDESSINCINSLSKTINIMKEKENPPFDVKTENKYIDEINSLKETNKSLLKTNDSLKNEIKIYQMKLNINQDNSSKDRQTNVINNPDDEDLINNITEEMNKWKQEYYKLSKINDFLNAKLENFEKNSNFGEENKFLKDSLSKKDELIMNLTLQIKEYQSKSDDIIIGNTNKSKERQIQILLNEVKGIRKRLLNIISLNNRITNFDEFISIINDIRSIENKIKDKNVKKAIEKLNILFDVYKLNNDMAYNNFIMKLYDIK